MSRESKRVCVVCAQDYGINTVGMTHVLEHACSLCGKLLMTIEVSVYVTDPDFDWVTENAKARSAYLRENTQTTSEYATARDAWNAAVQWVARQRLSQIIGDER